MSIEDFSISGQKHSIGQKCHFCEIILLSLLYVDTKRLDSSTSSREHFSLIYFHTDIGRQPSFNSCNENNTFV